MRDVIEQTLKKVPRTEWNHLPEVLLEPGRTRFFAFATREYLLLDFVDDEEYRRITALTNKGYNPFPGLIKPNDVQMSAAFRFEKSRNAFVVGCTINNMFSFSLGKDSTVVIRNHTQTIKTEELGTYNYRIKLAYLISFGDEINSSNLYGFIRELMMDSFRQWGISNV